MARAVGVCAESVRRWRRVWEQGGASALQRRAATGRPPKLDDTQVEMVRAALEQGVSAAAESWFWITFRARATEGHRNRDHERPRAARRTRLRSRSKLARPNICRFSILILLLWPSTAPEL
ncbi:helix-turn-helix domain-containing protein [Streptomyces sp. NPDC058293]|uniref:helix-turn-helix domain-containing protein n=1 Tax=Streptomyces sp. NPDC058293 TaxID=3346429 RepID=UPI0036EDD37C